MYPNTFKKASIFLEKTTTPKQEKGSIQIKQVTGKTGEIKSWKLISKIFFIDVALLKQSHKVL